MVSLAGVTVCTLSTSFSGPLERTKERRRRLDGHRVAAGCSWVLLGAGLSPGKAAVVLDMHNSQQGRKRREEGGGRGRRGRRLSREGIDGGGDGWEKKTRS